MSHPKIGRVRDNSKILVNSLAIWTASTGRLKGGDNHRFAVMIAGEEGRKHRLLGKWKRGG